ncbi:MAG: DUF975 family protein [Lachnospiraceae bacterium]|nr:DUF975 family protein [Lachnospiraceae bacterium]
MNDYLSSASLKSLAKGQLLGKYGTLIGACAIHMAFILIAHYSAVLLVYNTSIIGTIIYYIVSFIIYLIEGIFSFGEAYIYLKLACNQKVAVKDLFVGFTGSNTNKILAVQAVLSLISMICGIPIILFMDTYSSDSVNPYLFLLSVILMLFFYTTNVIISLMFSQSYYLMLDFPQYSTKDIFTKGMKLMKGSKGRLFYINLSFIPLFLLGMCTCCIGYLWILPYIQAVYANFYLDLMKKRR